MTNPGIPAEPRTRDRRFRLRLFGGIDLRDHTGAEITAVLAQPKRLALLAFLATAPAGRPRRRDSILGLFWPDADESSARNSLNRSISFLRGALGTETIVSRGKEELGVAPDRLWSDVAAFEAALADDDPAAAIELYAGELMDGFQLAGASELENWVSRERMRLRDRACTAAWAHAAEAEAAGDLDDALTRARRALELDLFDEPALRRLLGLMDRAGDRLGAARVYADFVRLLDREYEIEPSPETRALMDSVRSRVRTHARATVPEPAGIQAEPAVAQPPMPDETPRPDGAPDPEAGDVARRRIPLLPPRVRVAAGFAALLAVLTLGAFFTRPESAAPPSADPAAATVLVLPFTLHGGADLEFLGDGAASILSSSLIVPGVLSSVESRTMHAYLERYGADDGGTAAAVQAAASHFGARYVITGQVTALEGQIRVAATVLDVADGQHRLASISTQGDAAGVFELFDEVSRRVLAALPGTTGTQLSRAAARSTSSLSALRHYLEGEQRYRQGRFGDAVEAFGRAMQEDTTFALAHYRYSVAGDWMGSTLLGEGRAFARALRHTGPLPEQERLLIEGWRDYRNLRPQQAEQAFTRLLRDQPHHAEGWYRLGEVHFHWGGALGRSYRFARDAFERARRYDPADVGALMHLVRIAAAEGRRAETDTLVAQLERLQPDERTLAEARLLRDVVFGDAAGRLRALDEAAAAGPERALRAIRLVLAHSDDLAAALELADARERIVPRLTSEDVALRGAIELARGRPAAMHALLEAAGLPHVEEIGWLALALPWLPVEPDALARARSELAMLRQDEPAGPPRRLLIEALLAVRAGDSATAARVTALLEDARQYQEPLSGNARSYARVARAALLAAHGRPAEALDALGSPGRPGLTPTTFSYPHSYERYLRAMLLADLGRDEEALRWFATFPQADGADVAFRAAAHLEQARIYERLGRTDEAARQHRAAALLWQHAEPSVQALLRQAPPPRS